ncbi:MAG: hypothetical protein Q9209_005585 [Squamulea sp. 1 TL-2023]
MDKRCLTAENLDKNPIRKIQLHEYRIAARREKRLRKADEKKQRKLNATILRRMTRNPDKYNKNAERNRLRDIAAERGRIQTAAIKQIQQLAAVHDPSGVTFNIGPVVHKDDGSVVSAESLRRRQERDTARAAARRTSEDQTEDIQIKQDTQHAENSHKSNIPGAYDEVKHIVHPDYIAQTEDPQPPKAPQSPKLPGFQPRPRPPKPRIPDGISLPDGEQDWLGLWDLPDEDIERRIIRSKKGKAAERKALRIAQQNGKTERREARDEKRKVYRDIKLIWKLIREQQVKERTMLKAAEDEESKKVAVEVNEAERMAALRLCENLGFTIANTPGTEDIKPRALGMRGREVDFGAIKAGKRQGDVGPTRNKRVDLGAVAKTVDETYVPTDRVHTSTESEPFIKLDIGEGQDHEAMNFNHKLRRKLRRAIDNAQIQKEMLVRQRTLDQLEAKGIAPPDELKTGGKAKNIPGMRILESGATETAKQERVRARVELAEFNNASKVLRRQAKQCAIEAGLRKHAALTGRLPLVHQSTSTDSPSIPAYIKDSAIQAQATAAAAEARRSKTHSALERSEGPTDESSGESESDNTVTIRRRTKGQKFGLD